MICTFEHLQDESVDLNAGSSNNNNSTIRTVLSLSPYVHTIRLFMFILKRESPRWTELVSRTKNK
jgi:hypothetical protein